MSMSFAQGFGVSGIDCKGTQRNLEIMMEILHTWFVVTVTCICTFIKIHQTVPLKWRHFILCKLYLSNIYV